MFGWAFFWRSGIVLVMAGCMLPVFFYERIVMAFEKYLPRTLSSSTLMVLAILTILLSSALGVALYVFVDQNPTWHFPVFFFVGFAWAKVVVMVFANIMLGD